MGTRGLVGFKLGRKRKCTYNHYDSYPSGLGVKVVEFCRKTTKFNAWETLKKNVEKVELVSEDSKPTMNQQMQYRQFHDKSVSTGEITEWYSLLRDLQGVSILEQILLGNVEHMINSNDFIKDSLFCEYAYIINLNTMKLEMYEGFQQTGKTRKVKTPNGTWNQQIYAPCKKVGEFPLMDLPKDCLEIAFPKEDDED